MEAPRLTDITAEAFVRFKQNQDIYERLMQEKNAMERLEVPLTSYRNSVEEPISELMLCVIWIKADSIDAITEAQLVFYIELISINDPAK